MEDEDFELEQMIKRHKKAGGVLLGKGANCKNREGEPAMGGWCRSKLWLKTLASRNSTVFGSVATRNC